MSSEGWSGKLAALVLLALICPVVVIIGLANYPGTNVPDWQEETDLDTSDYEETFGIQSLCYTDCVFRDLKLVSDNATINFVESNRIFLTELTTVKSAAAWQNITLNALLRCVEPASKGTPAQIVTQSGRVCFTRPVILMTCIKRLMAGACPSIYTSQTCTYMTRTVQVFRFG